MSTLAQNPAAMIAARRPSPAAGLGLVIALTYAGLLLASFVNVLDPMVRHDDFPALQGEPSGFYSKTLQEGRWLNYWWHLRPSWMIWPAPANFVIYQFFWCSFAAAAAHNASRAETSRWYVVTLSLLIALAPSALLISTWFNTLIPGLGLVALYAVLASLLRPRWSRALLLIFVPLTLMAYTTYPLLLLVVCLTTSGVRRGWRDLIGLMVLFVLSFGLGLLAIYSLNYLEHGVFGIALADWRDPTPARDLASAIANLELVRAFLVKAALTSAFNVMPLMVGQLALFAFALAVLARKRPWRAIYIATGLLAGLGLLALQIVMTGVTVPVRAVGFAWMLFAVAVVDLALVARDRGGLLASAARITVLVLIFSYAFGTARQYYRYVAWQSETRTIAAQLARLEGPLFVTGTYEAMPSAERGGIQHARGLRRRLNYLTGRIVVMCEESAVACADLPDPGPPPADRAELREISGRLLLVLPAVAPDAEAKK